MDNIDDQTKQDIMSEHAERAIVKVDLTPQHGVTCEIRGGTVIVKSVANPTALSQLV